MLVVSTILAFAVGLSNFVNGLAFSFDATFHLVLSQLVNPAGISVVTNFAQLPQSYFGLTISPNSDPQDYTVYALNATNAECSYKYEVKTSSGMDYHSSGTCLSDAQAGSTASFLVDCTVDANAKNQANFILVSFQDGFASFQAFGDATASFQSGIPFFVGLNGLTVSSTSTGASIDFGSSIVWTQQNSSYQANPCVLVNCPASSSPSS